MERAKAIDFQRKGANFIKMLTLHEIDLLLDVGANIGQYASNLFVTGYQGKILSFEPLSSAYEKLVVASKSYYDWEVAERCASGDINGEIDINIANNSESSSVLPMLPAHLDAAEQSAYIGSEKVKIYKLSDIAAWRAITKRSRTWRTHSGLPQIPDCGAPSQEIASLAAGIAF